MKSKRRVLVAGIVFLLIAITVAWLLQRDEEFAGAGLKIGAVLPLTGTSGRYGQWIREGLELARHEINEQGGIEGRRLRIVYEDDQAQPQHAVSATQKLINVDDVPIIFGSWASSCVLAQAPIAEREQVVLMGIAISPQIRDAGDFTFRIQPDARYYLTKLVPFLRNEIGAESSSILYINNDFGRDQAQVFRRLFEERGGTVLRSEGYGPNTSDFRPFLTPLRGQDFDVLFVPGYAEVGTAVRQASELGIQARIVGSVPTENPDILEVAGQAANGVLYPSHFDPNSSDPRTQAFQYRYSEEYGRPAEGFAALAYDGLYVLSNALRACSEEPACIRDHLYDMDPHPGVTGTTSFDGHGDVVKPIIIKTIQDGQFVRFFTKSGGVS